MHVHMHTPESKAGNIAGLAEWYRDLPVLTEKERKEIAMQEVISPGSSDLLSFAACKDPEGEIWYWTEKSWVNGKGTQIYGIQPASKGIKKPVWGPMLTNTSKTLENTNWQGPSKNLGTKCELGNSRLELVISKLKAVINNIKLKIV